MSDNTLRGRLFEAPYHVNALLAFAFPSNALRKVRISGEILLG
jgi:hypothetical protein